MSNLVYKAVPLFMVLAPNDYGALPDNQWLIVSGMASTLWLQLKKIDQLGERTFVIPSGGTLQVNFPRADSFDQSTPGTITVTAQSINKTATANTDNKSLFSFAITADESAKILSGTVKFTITAGGIVTSWLQNWAVKKADVKAAK